MSLTLRTQSFHNWFLRCVVPLAVGAPRKNCELLFLSDLRVCSRRPTALGQLPCLFLSFSGVHLQSGGMCTEESRLPARIGLSDYCELMLCPKTVEVDTTREIDTLDCTTGDVVTHWM